jgi:hypothetical protein
MIHPSTAWDPTIRICTRETATNATLLPIIAELTYLVNVLMAPGVLCCSVAGPPLPLKAKQQHLRPKFEEVSAGCYGLSLEVAENTVKALRDGHSGSRRTREDSRLDYTRRKFEGLKMVLLYDRGEHGESLKRRVPTRTDFPPFLTHYHV